MTEPLRELRRDDRGHLDDVAIEQVQLFRLERMSKDQWWMSVVTAENDYVFQITTSGREVNVTVEVEPKS